MPTDKLYPAYVRIEYVTPTTQHTMTRPTLQWNGDGIGDPGTFNAHVGAPVPGDTMVEDFIDAMMQLYLPDCNSVAYTIFNVPEVGEDPQPVFGKNYSSVGGAVETDAGSSKAWVNTMQFRTSNFGLARVNLMEAARYGADGKFTAPLAGSYAAFAAEFSDETNGWAGRDNGRPAVYLNSIWKPNDRLIREYKGLW